MKDLDKEKAYKKVILIGEELGFWDFIWKHTLRDGFIELLSLVPASLGVILRMFLLKLFFKKCGKGLTVRNFVSIEFPENISIGNHVSLNQYCWLNGVGGIEVGDFVRIAPRVSIVSFSHEFSDPDIPIKLQGTKKAKVVVEDDVWIGAHCVIVAGVKIGKGSVIGAGSVVTRDIPSYSIAVGAPAKVIRKRE